MMDNGEFRKQAHDKLDKMFDAIDKGDFSAALMSIIEMRGLTDELNAEELHKCTCGGDCACKAAHSEAPVESGKLASPDQTAAADLHPRGLSLMNEAFKTINGERQDAYGNPEDTFGIIAGFWEVYLRGRGLSVSICSLDVAHMMSLLKIARETGGKGKRDNIVDLLGYAAIAGVMSGYDK